LTCSELYEAVLVALPVDTANGFLHRMMRCQHSAAVDQAVIRDGQVRSS